MKAKADEGDVYESEFKFRALVVNKRAIFDLKLCVEGR